MEGVPKPIACNVDGRIITFTNDDLQWDETSSGMVLNLGIANKNAEVSDQTPTPTRFIRNCEEVGLFQDLQNVNPFDETFKKAVESANSGTLHVPAADTSDDTLHTPHIFPPVEEISEKTARLRDQSTQADQQPSHVFKVESGTRNGLRISNGNLKEAESSDGEEIWTVDTDDCESDRESVRSVPVRSKLKESIIKRGNVSLSRNENDQRSPKVRRIENYDDDAKQRIRDSNRAAQLRCRKRKKQEQQQLEGQMRFFKDENESLRTENYNLRHKMSLIKELLIKEKTNDIKENTDFLSKIADILNTPPLKPKPKPPILKKNSRTRTPPAMQPAPKPVGAYIAPPQAFIPVPIIQTSCQPVIIQIMDNVEQIGNQHFHNHDC